MVNGMVGSQGLGVNCPGPPVVTELSPPMANRATSLMVSNTGTSNPIRSETKNLCVGESTQLISNELNGPPGSPVGLCSGTAITSTTEYWPPVVVPHVGQFGLPFPQPLWSSMNATIAPITSKSFVLIEESSLRFPI